MNSDQAKAEKFLKTVQFMTLAVVQSDGKPWAVPVHIAKREGWSFYWDSSADALHSQAIERSPNVMLSMYRLTDGDVKEFGFYGEAVAQAVETLSGGRKRYRADVQRAWINDERHEKRALKLT